jgi:molybdopterin synthase catalytic subunit
VRTALVTRAIDATALLREVASEEHGATSLFLGTVRDVNDGRTVTGIEYAAYSAMATAELSRIATEAVQRFGTERLVVEHRIGELALGDVSVAIAVSHPHRSPALDATRYVIEQLKRRVPIWKREHYSDGANEWVDPTLAARGARLSTAETHPSTPGSRLPAAS